uniref:DUF6533 domain-containing protein n=1 Tax=Moniliophthora roreri TaxID=221103 RepID=A0A0W0EX04_MONRR
MEWDWNSPQVENYFRDHQIQRLLQIFSISILFWDHIITFGKELELIWIHPKSRSSILFLAFRYFSLASNLIVTAFLGLDNWSIEVCSHYSLFRQVILFVSQAAVCSLLTLRLYALYACDKRVLVLYAITAVTAVALAGYALTGQKSIQLPIEYGCHEVTLRKTYALLPHLPQFSFFSSSCTDQSASPSSHFPKPNLNGKENRYRRNMDGPFLLRRSRILPYCASDVLVLAPVPASASGFILFAFEYWYRYIAVVDVQGWSDVLRGHSGGEFDQYLDVFVIWPFHDRWLIGICYLCISSDALSPYVKPTRNR